MEPTIEQFKQLVNEVITERGYFVIGYLHHVPELRNGATVRKLAQFNIDHPFRVFAKTNADDWKCQVDMVERLWGKPMAGYGVSDGSHFYKVSTD